MPRYNLRGKKEDISKNSSEMPISNEDSSSDNDGDRTIAKPDNAFADLQEQIRKLQLSLEASEKERLSLKRTLASTTAAVDTKIQESLADSGHNSTTAPVTPMYATTSTAADYTAYSSPHMSLNNAATLGTQTLNVTADVLSARSYAYTSFANTVSTNQHMSSYAQPFAPHFNLITGNCIPNVNFADINSTAAASLNGAPPSPTRNNNTHTTFMPSYNQHFIRKLQDLPHFSGSPEEWPMFIVAFKETTNMFGYTNLENLLPVAESSARRCPNESGIAVNSSLKRECSDIVVAISLRTTRTTYTQPTRKSQSISNDHEWKNSRNR